VTEQLPFIRSPSGPASLSQKAHSNGGHCVHERWFLWAHLALCVGASIPIGGMGTQGPRADGTGPGSHTAEGGGLGFELRSLWL
jgi:hypothetical protein